MSKDFKNDEIPLTLSSPAISETKARFESLLRAAMDRDPKEKKKDKFKGGEGRRKSKHKSKLASRSSSREHVATEGDSETYGSSSQLLVSDDSREENGISNNVKENNFSYNDKKGHNQLVVTPDNRKKGIHVPKIEKRTEIKKTADDSTNHMVHDTSKVKENFDCGKDSSDSVDSKNSLKKPVPLPRIRSRTFTKVPAVHGGKCSRSEDESSSETPKSMIVEALVSADNAAASFDARNGLPGLQKVRRRQELPSAEEIQMAEMDSSGTKLATTRSQMPCKSSSATEKKGKDRCFSSEEEEIKVDTTVHSANTSIDSPRKENNADQAECTDVATIPDRSNIYHYEKIVGIFVHHSDCLQPDHLVRHPVVRVHLICADTGQYLKKSNLGRSVSFFYENETVDYILPLMTQSYDFLQRRSLVPSWEELLVFNEDIEYILNPDLSVVVMFEILDFVSFSLASARYKKLGSEGGWYRIAWAFLKPVGKNGARNTEKKVRLQLYKPQSDQSFSCESCEAYVWWSTGQWDHYPGSLYVTVKGILPPDNLQPALRSRSALQSEHSSCHIDFDEPAGAQLDLDSSTAMPLPAAEQELHSLGPKWSRLPSQSCKVPNRRAVSIATPSRGCFAVKFSLSGLFLACAMASHDAYTIAILTIPEGREYVQLAGHQGLVYDLHWSLSDTFLLSASSDSTACIWDISNKMTLPLHMLPHPSFVYCAQFHPTNSSVIVTGCCDSVVRVWIKSRKTKQFQLFQELERHTGFVNTLCFNRHCWLFSGDSEGKICLWFTTQRKHKNNHSDWELEREICVRELRSTVINKLVAHPGGQRLLVHARDSLLRMLDIGTGSIIQWFSGALTHRVQSSACITPCGGLVWAASEDGTVCVWNADTGKQMATYAALGFHSAATGVDYHPQEHMAVFCSYGSTSHVVVCDYDRSFAGCELGLRLHEEAACSDASGQTDAVLQPSSLLTLPKVPSDTRGAETWNASCSEKLDVFKSAPLSDTVSKHSYSNEFSLNTNSLQREERLASILEKIDQVLSLPSTCVSANSNNSVIGK